MFLCTLGITMCDGSANEPALDLHVGHEWRFDIGLYANDEDIHGDLFAHMER